MDSFGGFSTGGEWDLCSSILSLDQELDFTPPIIPDAWFCSLDSFTANLNSCVFGANSSDENYDDAADQFPCIGAGDHGVEEKQMESFFSASSDIFLQEISGFCGEDRFLNVEVETHLGDNNATNPPANGLLHYHKRKSVDVLDGGDDQNKVDNSSKKIRTSNNVQKTRKATQSSNAKTSKQKLSTRRRKCEEELENGGSSDMNSCSSDNSSDLDDNASQHTNAGSITLLDPEASPSKAKTRATRGSATDPQTLYARKRRERINERLRILQKLVPNGTKVDISTMLEEAVHYVKFLQLQIKLLSSDDLWMYAPIAYNGMDIGLQQKLSSFL